MPLWLRGEEENDVVISTRVRLARNIGDIPFLPMLREKEMIQQIKATALLALNKKGVSDFSLLEMKEIGGVKKQSLIEKHLISRELAENPEGALLLGRDEVLSVMILEEDHYRLQCILGGYQIQQAYMLADELDTMLAKNTAYAFDDKLGYLTSCPTNVGTGMRVSVMMHLPALSLTGAISGVLSAIGKIGLTARGIFGEGTEAAGHVFQISNQVTLGLSEKEILENLKVTADRIIDSERQARKTIKSAWGEDLADRIFRALGILKYARKLSTEELLRQISDVNLGVASGVIEGVDHMSLYSLMMDTRPAIMMENNGEMSPQERDVKRAELARNILQNAK
jgi:protein arginine kinase